MSASRERRTPSQIAVASWFLMNGFIIASWVVHVPRQSTVLKASPGVLGLALICMAVGSIVGMMIAPVVARRFGSSRSGWAAGLAVALLLSLPVLARSIPALGLALFVFGVVNGVTGVTINATAVACERESGRPLMSTFHGWFSVGMVAGVTVGSALLMVGFSPGAHAAAASTLAAVVLASARPTPQRGATADARSDAQTRAKAERGAALNGPVLGVAVLAFVCMFLEGAMADWAGLLATSFGAGPTTAPLAYAAFTIAWAGGRFLGDRLTTAVGEPRIVRGAGLLAAAGVGLALLTRTPGGTAAGCFVVGLGLANAVPILFRAAGADPNGRGLALVTGIGHTGFLIGPPLVGFTADVVGLPNAMLLLVAGGLLLSTGAVVLQKQSRGVVTAPTAPTAPSGWSTVPD